MNKRSHRNVDVVVLLLNFDFNLKRILKESKFLCSYVVFNYKNCYFSLAISGHSGCAHAMWAVASSSSHPIRRPSSSPRERSPLLVDGSDDEDKLPAPPF